MSTDTVHYRVALTPDATLEVEESCNVVLVTPERRITITNVQRWADELVTARQIAWARFDGSAEAGRRPRIRPAYATVPGDRIVQDGIEVTVTDVQRDEVKRHVTLTTNYGAPRTVTWDARVPHVQPGV